MAGEGAVSKGIGRDQKLALLAIFIVALAGLAGVLIAGSSQQEATVQSDFAYPNGDLANSRAVGGPIQAATVSNLAPAWTLPLAPESTFGSYRSTPAIANDVAFWQDSNSGIRAIEIATGRVLWQRQYGSPTTGSNGVVVAAGRVFSTTPTNVFALDRETGDELWSVRLANGSSEEIQMPPGHYDGRIYVSTAPARYKGGEVGVLWALDARTGKKVWSFNTVPRGLWGNPKLNYGGGLLEPPAFDAEGSMYFGVGAPGPIAGTKQKPWGSSRPGPNLYTASLIKLDASTGKYEWHHQVTPHALCDWPLQGPPLLVDGKDRKLAIISGKAGVVVAVDQGSGELVWKRSVGIHNGHDNDGVQAMKGDYSNLALPMTVYPGNLGGVASSPSTDGATVFVPVMNYAATLYAQLEGEVEGARTGEVVALDVNTGELRWKRAFPEAVYGPTSVVNDLVFASTIDGVAYALDSASGETVWQASLPAGMPSGFGISGNTVLAPAGLDTGSASGTQIVAYRLNG